MRTVLYSIAGAATIAAAAFAGFLGSAQSERISSTSINDIVKQDPKTALFRKDRLGNICVDYDGRTFVVEMRDAQSYDGINSLISRFNNGRETTPTMQTVFRTANGMKDSGLTEGRNYWVPKYAREKEC